jgi:hypothetical protein
VSNASSTNQSSGTSDDPLTGSVDQLLTLLKRRKILWEFHTGTAQAESSGSDVAVLIDGDKSSILARTLCGRVKINDRVAIIFVPPSGYYIVGIIGGDVTQLSGLATVTVLSGQAGGNQTVNFIHPFRDTPAVVASTVSGAGAAIGSTNLILSVFPDRFTFQIHLLATVGANTNFTVAWIAMLTDPT